MPLTAGQSLTHYEILAPLGAGGMGEVWRARDTRLEREVAIKVLPEHFADDEERLKRFEREAKTLASLNHPNVAGIHGIDQVGDTCFLAMELVPGEDLAARLARGPLPVAEAIDVGRQIAEGLEAAHEAGVVHRDLKPANVRLTPGGVVKVLDFGLAKPIDARTGKEGTTTAESDSFLVTEEGLVLGTPTYMSPEQARGKPVDRRTDVWAFGCVLYECLTGKRAYAGEAFGDLLVAILEHEPDLAAFPTRTPARVRELVARCLDKDPRRRLRDVGEARILLADEQAGRSQASDVAESGAAPRRASAVPWAVVALAAIAATYGLLRGDAGREPASEAPRQQVRFAIRHPVEGKVALTNPVVAPDGSYVAYTAFEGSSSRLWVRDLDAREARALPGTDSAVLPFVSPDGRYLGYFAGGRLKKVAVSGGAPVDVCEAQGSPGASWTEDGWILFSQSWTTGLARVRSEGGPIETLTTLDAEAGETGHWWPEPLPGGERVLYTVFTAAGTLNRARIALLDLATGRSQPVCEGAHPVLLGPGHLLYFRAGVYEVAPFDLERGELTGPPTTVTEDVPPLHPAGTTQRFLHVSRSGVLAYLSRRNDMGSSPRSWFRMDPSGVLERLELPPSMSADPDLSPDGRHLAMVGRVEGETDIFVHDLARGSQLRLTTESVNDRPKWSPDGTRLFFDSIKLGTYDVFEADPSGARGVWPVFTRETDVTGGGLIAGTEQMVVQLDDPDGGGDLFRVDLETGAAEPLVVSPGGENSMRLSPDGRLVAYTSNFSGRNHVYVAPLERGSRPVMASRAGGHDPRWTEGGAQLAFHDGADILRVDVTLRDGSVVIGEARPFVDGGLPEDVSRRFTGEFAISAEGSYVILGLVDEPAKAELEVVLDGPAALGAR